jgi:hypothetical protein
MGIFPSFTLIWVITLQNSKHLFWVISTRETTFTMELNHCYSLSLLQLIFFAKHLFWVISTRETTFTMELNHCYSLSLLQLNFLPLSLRWFASTISNIFTPLSLAINYLVRLRGRFGGRRQRVRRCWCKLGTSLSRSPVGQ